MQPPRHRRPKGTRPLSRLGRAGAVEIGAALCALLLARIAVLAIPGPDASEFTRWFSRATEPIVWPAAHLPGGSTHLIRGLTVADLLTTMAIGLAAALTVGIIAGWEIEGGR